MWDSSPEEELRRSKRISQRSGERATYEGKYSEPDFELLEDQPCSAACLNASIKKDSVYNQSVRKATNVKIRVETPGKKKLVLSAFKSSTNSSLKPIVRPKVKAKSSVNAKFSSQPKSKTPCETTKSAHNSKSRDNKSAKKAYLKLFRSATISDLSDTSFDDNSYTRIKETTPGGAKSLNTIYTEGSAKQTSEVTVNINNLYGQAVDTAVASDCESDCSKIDITGFSKETDYDTCESESEWPGINRVTPDSGCIRTESIEQGSATQTKFLESEQIAMADEVIPQPSSDMDLKTLILSVQKTLQRSIDDSKAELQRDIGDETEKVTKIVEELREDYRKVSQNLNSVEGKLTVFEQKLNTLTNILIVKDQELRECRSELETLQLSSMRSNLVIGGLVRKDKEKCKEVVVDFCKKHLSLEDVKVLHANRMGKGKRAPMFVKLPNPAEKMKILSKGSYLKGITNEFNDAYSIDEQLPPRIREEKKRKRALLAANKKSTVDKLKMSFKQGQIIVDEQEYRPMIKAPQLKSVLKPTVAELGKWMEIEICKGNTITEGSSEFTGYSAVVKDLQEVEVAYNKVKSQCGAARHLMCAFRIPHEKHHIHQDFYDDYEHSGGKILLDALKKSNIYNRAVFVARVYDGVHIGPKRFEAIRSAAKSVFTIHPFNKLLKENQYLSTDTYKANRQSPDKTFAQAVRGSVNDS